MKIKLFILAVLALVAASCAKNELIEQPQPRMLRVTATVEEPAQTRAELEHLSSGAIRFKWQTTDVIQMAFVQGAVKKTANAAITSVSADGRTAQFEVEVPAEITGDFTLYAYRSSNDINGGGILSPDNPVVAILPKMSWTLSKTLYGQRFAVSLWCKQDVAYGGGGMPAVSLAFRHLGAMMTVKIKNLKSEDITNINLHIRGTNDWVFNHRAIGGAEFDMQAESYIERWGNTGMPITNDGIKVGENTFYTWFVPGDYHESHPITLKAWPSGGASEIKVSSNSKNQINFQPGKNYTVYITIGDGTGDNIYDLKFTDSNFN